LTALPDRGQPFGRLGIEQIKQRKAGKRDQSNPPKNPKFCIF
jgi:hypothetical protein